MKNLIEIANKPFYIRKNYKAPKEPSFSYLRYRFLRPLLKFYYRSYKQFNGTTPWTSPASIAIFDHWLQNDMVGFEWGSGSSTLFFAQRLKSLISVEHNEGWYQKVRNMLQQRNISNTEYIFVKIQYPDKELDKDGYQPALTPDQIQAYKEYFQAIDQYPNEYFDFVLIDGRARVQCGEHAIPKLKKGGMLVLDNSERLRYQSLKDQLKDWPCIWTTSGLTDTTIWFKP